MSTKKLIQCISFGVDKSLDPLNIPPQSIITWWYSKNFKESNFNTMTSPNDNHRYFVNNFSRVNTVPKSELRNSDGSLAII